MLGGAAAVGTVVLGGCSLLRKDISGPAAAAAAAVDGVASVQLERALGATFERILRGTIDLETSDRVTGLAVFDDAMRAIITVIHDELDEETATRMRVGGVTAVLQGGAELTPMDLGPDMVTANPRHDRITAGSFYRKYGLG